MWRVHLIISFLLTSFPVALIYAQQPATLTPASFANTYTFTDKDDVTGYNYAVFYTGPSGRRYMTTYGTKGTQVMGNNWTRSLTKIDNRLNSELIFYEPRAAISEPIIAWAASKHNIFLLEGDSVHQIFKNPSAIIESSYHIYSTPKGFYFIQGPENGLVQALFFSFLTRSFQPPISWKIPEGNEETGLMKDTADNLFMIAGKPDSFALFQIIQPRHQLQFVRSISRHYGSISYLLSEDCFVTSLESENGDQQKHTFWQSGRPVRMANSPTTPVSFNRHIAWRMPDNTYQLLDCHSLSGTPRYHNIFCRDGVQSTATDPVSGAFYLLTPNKPLRVFPWIKQYPFLYGGSNSAATFSLSQDSTGAIWAGSYNSSLSRIIGDTVVPFPLKVGRMMNGGQWINGEMLLVEESPTGLTAFTSSSRRPGLSGGITGFYTFLSRDNYFYFGTAGNNGLWRTTTQTLTEGKPQWEKISKERGINLSNILTITEDTLGRIWCGHPTLGMAVYDPVSGQAQTWHSELLPGIAAPLSSLRDSRGTVWLGGRGALWYYNDYKLPVAPEHCRRIRHPLLAESNLIMAMTLWEDDWLLVSAYDRILVLDLKEFYKSGKVIMRYLNPQEAAFTSFTEQNTLFKSHTDNTLWFSTSDNVYQWDIAQWMALPQFQTSQNVFVNTKNGHEQLLEKNGTFKLASGLRTFEIQVMLTSPDALPRYMRTALVKHGDSVVWKDASLQSVFTYNNVYSGHYQFLVEIFETDGSITQLSYQLYLKPHFWQTIWFWAMVCLIVSGFTFAIIYFNLKARTKKAELEAFRSEQNKKMADLRLLTTANQFRPHFILNALNTIGSRMPHDAHTEQVLSSLGNSINIIFNNAKRQGVLHPFPEEWKLVEEVINIHQLMYLPQLKKSLPGAQELKRLSRLMVPLGLLQIPVENALLHGLGNVEEGATELAIRIQELEANFEIIISDTGVGMDAAAKMSNATGHGSGIKNLKEMLRLLAVSGAGEITIDYEQGFKEQRIHKNSKFGTHVRLTIPKTFAHE